MSGSDNLFIAALFPLLWNLYASFLSEMHRKNARQVCCQVCWRVSRHNGSGALSTVERKLRFVATLQQVGSEEVS